MKFLQQLEPLVEPHTTAIEENLSESSVITALDRLRRYTARDIADFTFLHILTLHVLNTSVDFATAVKGYATRTLRIKDFDKLSFTSTDLYVFLHLMLGRNKDKLKPSTGNAVFFNHCHLQRRDITQMLVWLKEGSRSQSREIRDTMMLEKNLQIETSNYRSCRRIINHWDDESTANKRLVVTRLLLALRTRCPRSDLLVHLEAFAKEKQLELTDVTNPEECHEGQ